MRRRQGRLTSLCKYILQEFHFHELQKICMILKEDGDRIACGGKNVTKKKLSRSLCKYYKPEMYGLFLESFDTDVGVHSQHKSINVEFEADNLENALLYAAMMAERYDGKIVLKIVNN